MNVDIIKLLKSMESLEYSDGCDDMAHEFKKLRLKLTKMERDGVCSHGGDLIKLITNDLWESHNKMINNIVDGKYIDCNENIKTRMGVK